VAAQDERLVALVRPAVDGTGILGHRCGDYDAGHPADVELEPGPREPFDLFVLGDEHLAALVAHFFTPGFLVLDVITGTPDLDEAAD